MVTKEDHCPAQCDKLIHFLAPVVLVVPTLLAYAVLPFGRNLVPIDLDAGILFFFAVGGPRNCPSLWPVGPAANKYSLARRHARHRQMISYEIPLIISSVTVIMLAGRCPFVQIVAQQDGHSFSGLVRIGMFSNHGVRGLIIFLIASLAESTARRSTSRRLSPKSSPAISRNIPASSMRSSFLAGIPLAMFAVSGVAVLCSSAAGTRLGVSRRCAFLSLVFCQAHGAGFSVHLDSRERCRFARGPIAQTSLEIHAADSAPQFCRGRRLHFTSVWNDSRAPSLAMACSCAAMIAVPTSAGSRLDRRWKTNENARTVTRLTKCQIAFAIIAA